MIVVVDGIIHTQNKIEKSKKIITFLRLRREKKSYLPVSDFSKKRNKNTYMVCKFHFHHL